jgi:citrate lyase subunit beta/citryl-CoA lyase
MTVLRNPLFVPGNQPKMLEKVLGLSPDAYVPDLEDSVPLDEKENARAVTADLLPRLAAAGPLVIPRVNALDTGLIDDDLAAVVGPHIFAVSVGKVKSAADVQRISDALRSLERKTGLEDGRVKLVLWLETAQAIVNAYQVCAASPRVVAVAFGAEDFTNDMGIERTRGNSEIEYPRRVVTVAARAADVLALDTPYFAFRDPDGLRDEAREARGFGFTGKFAIHPAQIEIIREAFSPSDEEVAHARRVVAAFEEAEKAGRGSTSLDGEVIDLPVVRRARGLLAMAAGMHTGSSDSPLS